MPTEAGRKAARLAVQREIARTGSDAAALGRKAGVHAQTVQSFLNGSRWPALRTLGRLDVALGWEVGTLNALSEEESAEGTKEPNGTDVPLHDPGLGTVGPASHDGDHILWLRPEGISDKEWDRIRTEAMGFVEWQIEKAVRERQQGTQQ